MLSNDGPVHGRKLGLQRTFRRENAPGTSGDVNGQVALVIDVQVARCISQDLCGQFNRFPVPRKERACQTKWTRLITKLQRLGIFVILGPSTDK